LRTLAIVFLALAGLMAGPTALLAWGSSASALPVALFGVIAVSLAGCGLTRSPTLQGLLAVGVGLTFMALFFVFLAWAERPRRTDSTASGSGIGKIRARIG